MAEINPDSLALLVLIIIVTIGVWYIETFTPQLPNTEVRGVYDL